MKIFTVDAFTDVPFKGNPAAVCVLDKKIADQQCLCIAQLTFQKPHLYI